MTLCYVVLLQVCVSSFCLLPGWRTRRSGGSVSSSRRAEQEQRRVCSELLHQSTVNERFIKCTYLRYSSSKNIYNIINIVIDNGNLR